GNPDGNGTVRDVVAWWCRTTVPLDEVEAARVQRGPWRLFVLIRHDGTSVALLGSSPAQWPSRLLESSRAQDVEDLEVLLGGTPGDGTPPTTT
ncbi:MAG: hypothetical protein ACKO04_04910, partial [Actinomycetes bacterium]